MSLIERRDEARRQDRLHELANAVREMETLIQKTHAASARVTAAFAAAAVAEGLSPIAGHQFVSQVSRVTMHTSDALSHSADAHRLLRRLGTSLGYDVTAFGDTACPDDEMFVGPMGQTKRVAA